MRTFAASGENQGGVLQGRIPKGMVSNQEVYLSWLYLPTTQCTKPGDETSVYSVPAGGQQRIRKEIPYESQKESSSYDATPEPGGVCKTTQSAGAGLVWILLALLPKCTLSDERLARRCHCPMAAYQVRSHLGTGTAAPESTGPEQPPTVCSLALSPPWTSRMMGDYHVRFCEGLGVKLPQSTRRTTRGEKYR